MSAHYECIVDGGSRGQGFDPRGGQGAAAVLIYKNNALKGQYARPLGRCTNNQAEYEAVILALLICWAADLHNPIIYSDSQIVVNQIAGKWKCNENLAPYLLAVREIQSDFYFRIVHVSRSRVSEADLLVQQILDNSLLS